MWAVKRSGDSAIRGPDWDRRERYQSKWGAKGSSLPRKGCVRGKRYNTDGWPNLSSWCERQKEDFLECVHRRVEEQDESFGNPCCWFLAYGRLYHSSKRRRSCPLRKVRGHKRESLPYWDHANSQLSQEIAKGNGRLGWKESWGREERISLAPYRKDQGL